MPSPSEATPNPDIIRPNPATFKRNPDTGLIEGFPYQYGPDGRIDWRRHVDPRYLYVIREKEAAAMKAQGKALADLDLSLVDERWLRIKLAGFNQLANLRGYRSIQYHSLHSSDSKAAVVCEIEFIGNVETEGLPIVCSGIASATIHSTGPNFASYLECFAENRAFARCVKRALQINILSEDEIDSEAAAKLGGADNGKVESDASTTDKPTGFQPHHHLAEKCRLHKPVIAFEALKAAAVKLKTEMDPSKVTAAKPHEPFQGDPAAWTSFEDIQPIDAWFLMGKIEEKAAAVKSAGGAKGKA